MKSYIVSNNGLVTLMVNGKVYLIGLDHKNYEQIKQGLLTLSEDELQTLADIPKAIMSWAGETVTVVNGEVLYKGEPLHNVVADKAVALMEDGWPVEPLLRFIENLMANPSRRAVSELYGFLSHHGMPITETGTFICYKAVKEDFTDKHTGTVDNHPGQEPQMERNEVDDDCDVACSYGFHAGAWDYVKSFAQQGDHILLVEVNPKDVVSIPKDHNETKLRTCKYKVLEEFTGDRALMESFRRVEEEPEALEYEEDEDDYEEDDYEDDFDCCDDDNYDSEEEVGY